MEAYYYNHMGKEQQQAYRAMKEGLTTIQPSFPVPRLEHRVLTDIFFLLRLDCPEIFYATGFRYRFYPDSSSVELIPEYLFDKTKIREHQKAMEARVEKLVRPAENLSEWEKELYIHDFICNNVYYDKLKKPYSHEIIGPLGHGVGVCEGIAKTVKILCDRLKIWCIIAISDANPEKKIRYRHAWNIVKIGGNFTHLDATFDNTLGRGSGLRHDYYNLGDRHHYKDHEPLLYGGPCCEVEDQYYYRIKKLSFTKIEEVEKRAVQAVKKGKPLVFHWRGGYLSREVVTELVDIFRQAAEKRNQHARIRLNVLQAVFWVSFSESIAMQEIVEECADEDGSGEMQ